MFRVKSTKGEKQKEEADSGDSMPDEEFAEKYCKLWMIFLLIAKICRSKHFLCCFQTHFLCEFFGLLLMLPSTFKVTCEVQDCKHCTEIAKANPKQTQSDKIHNEYHYPEDHENYLGNPKSKNIPGMRCSLHASRLINPLFLSILIYLTEPSQSH